VVSQENVDFVCRHLEDWQRGDFEAFLAKAHPELEWGAVLERLVEGPGSSYRGHEGVRRLWHAYRTELEGFEIEADEIRDAGGDRVVLLGHIRWRGAASGVPSESPLGMVITVRDGKMFHSIDYLSHHEALKAAGVVE
jgi:ketosteroid isomerase-like protein